MVQTQVVEHSGVLLRVDYETSPSEPITYKAIHVLDDQYRVTGPDLTPLLDGLVLVGAPAEDGVADAEKFLSRLIEELQNERVPRHEG